MKMKKTLVALCLSAGMLACVPGMSLADVNFVPQNTSAAPAIPASALQQLIWTPADQSKTQSVDLTTGGQRLDVPGIVGPVAAWSVPANIGELTLTLDSELNKHKQIFAPNVLILDQNMTPAAFFPSNYFTYQQPGVMTADRLGGVMRLTPALGQQKLYVLVFTTEKDLQQTTTLLDPAKAYAKGAGNAAPDIPDPIAKHTTDGVLKLKVKTNSTRNFADNLGNACKSILVGLIALYGLNELVYRLTRMLVNNHTNLNDTTISAQIHDAPRVTLLIVIFLAPFVEEVLFRGLVFGNLKSKSRTVAYVVSCLLFALLHVWQFAVVRQDITYFLLMVQYLVPGLVLAWAYDHTGTLWSSILLHAAANALHVSAGM